MLFNIHSTPTELLDYWVILVLQKFNTHGNSRDSVLTLNAT